MKKRILSLLLCCCLLAGAFRPTQAHAIAGVDDAALLAAGGVALVGSLLVAGGAAFKSNDDLQAGAQDIYDRYIQPSSALLSEVTGLVQAWYKGVGSGVVCCANISTRLWNAVCGDPVAENVAVGNYGAGKSFHLTSDASLDDLDYWHYISNNYFTSFRAGGHSYAMRYDRDAASVYWYKDGSSTFDSSFGLSNAKYDKYAPHSIYVSSDTLDGKSIRIRSNWWADGGYVFPYPCTISFGAAISYPTDKDLIRPGDKSAVVQLPSDLPRYGEDGATVEMPVLGLTQEDYLITGSDVLAPDKVDEDVILDVKTGTKVGESSGEITEPTTPVAGNILDWLKSVLKGLLDAIIALLQAIRDGILSIPQAIAKAIAAVFTPSAEATDSLQGIAAEHLPIAVELADISKRVVSVIESPSGSGGLGYTLSVDLGKHVGGGWSDTVITLLDVSWYKPYKPLVDDTIVGLAWLLFLWNLYGALPSIIHGMASGLNVTSRIDDKGGFGL